MPLLRQLLRPTALVLGLWASLASVRADEATEFALCNRTGGLVYTALVFYDPGKDDWVLSGWWTIQPGACFEAGRFRGDFVYYYAEKKGGRSVWPPQQMADLFTCVPKARTDRLTLKSRKCRRGERNLGFFGVPLTPPRSGINLVN